MRVSYDLGLVPAVNILLLALLVAACSGGHDGDSNSPAGVVGRSAEEITGPVSGGQLVYPQPAVPVPAGYVEEEYFIGGIATSFVLAGAMSADGFWDAAVNTEANYRTRVIVRRPPADAFSGTVIIEWLNVSVLEASPDWAYLAEEIGRRGHAYIAVSTQQQGVMGGETILELGDEPIPDAGDNSNSDNSGLVNINPERYGTLTHPGDQYAFDIFSQVGKAARENTRLLGGLPVERVIGAGESQSAYFLTSYANAIHPLNPVYDGLLIHSRGASAAPLTGESLADTSSDDDASFVEDAFQLRTDLDIPVFIFEAETDLTLLGYANARQPDTDRIRTWEVAGTAHADAHQFRALLGGPRDPSLGSLLGCPGPINTGPHHEVLQAALSHLVKWITDGTQPPSGERLELLEGEELMIARADDEIALGGIRTPLVDVPVFAATGEPDPSLSFELGGDFDVCALFGTTITFDQAELISRYGTADNYVQAFMASADATVDAGFLLREDADQLVEEAQANRSLFE